MRTSARRMLQSRSSGLHCSVGAHRRKPFDASSINSFEDARALLAYIDSLTPDKPGYVPRPGKNGRS
jgi:hypothetical protein